jgi:hypothetical protein
LQNYNITSSKKLENKSLNFDEVTNLAMKIAESRGYPKEMGLVVNKKPLS